MGSAAVKFLRTEPKFEIMESSKIPSAKDVDARRRNSLAFFMRDWQQCETYEQQEISMVQVKRYHQMEANVETCDPVMTKLNKTPQEISLGDMRLLRDRVIMKWKDINRSYQGPLLHTVCREGYVEALKLMIDPKTKSGFETQKLDLNILNKRKRTPLMICFTSPHFTIIAKNFGLMKDPETGLAVPRPKRPNTAQTEQDWMKPGTRAGREELVRILVENLNASVTVLDIHDYSLLHYAAISGWEGTIGLLLDHPRQTCVTGETALHMTVSLRHGKAAEILLKRCPDIVDEADKEGDRAIHLALQNGDQEIVRLLADVSADMNFPNYSRITPLSASCKLQDWQMVNLLLALKVTRDDGAFALLEGVAERKIQWRLKREEENRLKLATDTGDAEAQAAKLKVMKAYGQWVAYIDKMRRGVFYYNKVSRESRWWVPRDYFKENENNHIMKTATFGIHFITKRMDEEDTR